MNTKEKLMQLLELCIEKNLNFDYGVANTITVCALNKEKEGFSIYERFTIYPESLDKLITKVKNYQP